MKKCGTCLEIRQLEDFAKRKASPSGLSYTCKFCMRIASKRHHVRHRQENIDRTARRRQACQKAWADFKSTLSCSKCPENNSCCLDFHHLDPTQKDFVIGEAALYKTLASLKAELDKCVVLCSNCHRKLHAGLITL